MDSQLSLKENPRFKKEKLLEQLVQKHPILNITQILIQFHILSAEQVFSLIPQHLERVNEAQNLEITLLLCIQYVHFLKCLTAENREKYKGDIMSTIELID